MLRGNKRWWWRGGAALLAALTIVVGVLVSRALDHSAALAVAPSITQSNSQASSAAKSSAGKSARATDRREPVREDGFVGPVFEFIGPIFEPGLVSRNFDIYQGQPDDGSWLWPADSRVITSPFGPRSDPITGRPAFHTGIDIRAACGDEIWASREGTVTFAGWLGGYGNRVVIDHGNGLQSSYSHLVTALVQVGDQVQQRQSVGVNGNTGYSTGCHLHFEIIVKDKFADPMPFMGNAPSVPAPTRNPLLPNRGAQACAVNLDANAASQHGGAVAGEQSCTTVPVTTPKPSASATPDASASTTPAASAVSSPAPTPSAAQSSAGSAQPSASSTDATPTPTMTPSATEPPASPAPSAEQSSVDKPSEQPR